MGRKSALRVAVRFVVFAPDVMGTVLSEPKGQSIPEEGLDESRGTDPFDKTP